MSGDERPTEAGRLSPDGLWRWEGSQWALTQRPDIKTNAPRQSRAWIFWLAGGCALLLVIGMVGAGIGAYIWSQRFAQASRGPHPELVYTKWEPDSSVTNGPEPGYRPVLTDLTGIDVRSATATTDPSGSRVVDVTFSPAGGRLLAQLTRDNVAACPGDPSTTAAANCAQRHLALWLGLTQTDIDNWDTAGFAEKVSETYDTGCIAHAFSWTICPKFISDPITIQAIDQGVARISGYFTEKSAIDLAMAINLGSH